MALAWLILRYGKWTHSGENFNRKREESTRMLTAFTPTGNTRFFRNPSRSFLWRNAFTRNLLVQISFLKASWKTKGGHLTADNLCCIRIPKSGSTSLSMMMLEKIYPSLKQKTISTEQINYLADLNLETQTGSGSEVYFTVVRNPFSRLVSVYRDFFGGGSSRSVYKDYLFGILPQQLSFAEFVDRLTQIPDRLKDQHLKPQHGFLKYYQTKNQEVQVFKLEDPETLNTFLNSYEMELPHLNKSGDHYDYRTYYTASILEKAFALYRTDIEIFGYSETWLSLKEHVKSVHK